MIVVRLFNTVGPRQTGQYGMVIPNFVRQALAGQPITVFGDGTQSRSFTYVGDVVRAMVALINEPARGRPGVQHRQRRGDLDRRSRGAHQDADGSQSAIVQIPYDEAYEAGLRGHAAPRPDISKIHALVGYAPTVELDEILTRVIEYFRQQ